MCGVIVVRSVMPREREGSAVSRAITSLAMRLASKAVSQGADGYTLELMFVLPDSEEGPLFEGMRLSTYAEDQKILVVEAAVPVSMIDSDRAAAYVAAVAADAVDAAREFFEELRMPFDAESRHDLLGRISTSDLQRPLLSHDLPESAWVEATGSGGSRSS
jgi:hypothetical protein